jgi:hypothetical protein
MSLYDPIADRLVRNHNVRPWSETRIARFFEHINTLPRKIEAPKANEFRDLMHRVRGVIR